MQSLGGVGGTGQDINASAEAECQAQTVVYLPEYHQFLL